MPLLDSKLAEIKQTYGGTEPDVETCEVSYFAFGVLPEELARSYYTLQAEIIAPHVDKIPGWLGKNPPLAAVIVPEGIASLGTPGDGVGRYNMRWSGESPSGWALFNHLGEFQHLGYSWEPWQALFFENYSKLRNEVDSEDESWMFEYGQYVVVYHYSNNNQTETTDIYDYTGKKLDIGIDEVYADGGKLQPLYGEMIRLVYEIQQLEKTDHEDR